MRRLVVLSLIFGLVVVAGGIWIFNQQEPQQVTYRCRDLKVSATDSQRVFRFTTTAEAVGATPLSVGFEFGDGSLEWVIWPTPHQSSQTAVDVSYSHIYLAPGDYLAQVQVKFRVRGAYRIVTSSRCRVLVQVP